MADVPGKFFKATKVRTGVSPSSPGVIEGETLPPLNPPGGSLNSVGLSMPSAFNVANSPLTSNGTLAVTGAGTVGQYIRGDGSLADFPQASGGGSSVSYYLNGSVNQGTIGGVAYRELSKVPILGAGTDFTINADGYIASFITDAGDPNLLEIPGGNWNFETYFSASSGGGSPTFYVELYKYDGTTFTLIASSSTSPEFIAFGTNLTPYYSTLAVPTTTLALTDRLAIRYYVTHSGRTITLHTENNHLCQIVTTFTTGITALNGLTAQVQNFAVGTSGTDFNIASATATHTFNLPTASATNRGALSSADWSLFRQAYNDKINSASVTGTTTKTLTLVQQDGGEIQASWSDLNTDAVTSVFGRTGAVVAVSGDYNTSQVTESGNLYFTQARVSANTDVAANTAARHNAVTLGTANGLSLSTQQLSLGLASGSTTGALSSTDWNTFNNKQNALINPVTGTGTSGRIAYWDGTNSITSDGGLTWDDASNRLTIGLLSTNVPLVVSSGNVNESVALFTGNNVGRGLTFITYNSGADDSGVNINAQHSSGQISLSTAGNQRVIISNDSVNFRHTTLAGNSISFDTSYQDAFTINSLGRILINSTSDNGARFQVSDSNLFLASLIGSGGESILRLQNTGVNGRNWYIIAGGNIGAFSNGQFGIYDATSNTPRLTITNTGAVIFSNSVTAGSFVRIGGTSGQFLKADGSVDSTAYGTGSVTSVAALTLGTSGTDLSSSVANSTTTPVITLNVPTASAANRGALSAADWTTFNNKENAIAAGTTAQYYRGDKTFQTLNTAAVPELTNLYFTTARVLATELTGYVSGANTALAATDTILGAFGKVQGQLNAKQNALNGTGFVKIVGTTISYDNTNYLPLTGGTLTGTLNGTTAVFSNTITGFRGTFTDGNQGLIIGYYTNGNGFGAIYPSTVTPNNQNYSFIAKNDSTVLHAASGGSISLSINNVASLTIDSSRNAQLAGKFSLRADASGSVTTQVPVFIANPASTTRELVTRTPAEFRSDIGAGNVNGTGTTNYLPKFTGTSTIGNSQVFDNGTNVGIGTASPNAKLEIASGVPISTEIQRWSYNNGNADFSLRLKQEVTSGLVTHVFDVVNNATTYSNNLVLTNGNIGISVTPRAWASNYRAIQISSFAALTQGGNDTYLGNNWFNDGSNKYLQTSGASIYGQSNGSHFWLTAPSGTAGNAITFTQAMTLNAIGNLGLGVIPSAWDSNFRALQVRNVSLANFNTNSTLALLNNGYFNTDWRYVSNASVAMYVQSTNADHIWYNAPSGTAGNAISFTQAMTLFATGNLLVGTPSPISDNGARLQVSGSSSFSTTLTANNTAGQPAINVRATDSNFALMSIFGNQAGDVNWLLMSGYPNAGNFTIRQSDTVDALVIQKTTGAATFSSSVTAGGPGTFQGVNDGTAIFARRTGGANVFALNVNLDSSWTMFDHAAGSYTAGITQKNGNLGLGVTPSAWNSSVRVIEIANTGNFIGNSGNDNWLATNTIYDSGATFRYARTGSAVAFYSQSSGGHFWFQAPSGTAGNAISFTQAMTLFATGNLLVGTPSPISDNGARLQVSGAATFSSSVTATSAIISGASSRIRLTDTNITNPSFNTLLIEASAQNKFSLGVNSTSSQNYAITIDGITQNVGIGTPSPSTLLHIEGAAPIFTMNRSSGGFFNRINFSSGGTNYASIISDAGAGEQRYSIGPSAGWGGYHTFYTDTAERMRIFSGGNVRIGGSSVTDNGNKLRVDGNVWVDAPTSGKVSIVNSSGVSTTIGVGATTGYVGTNSDHQLDFFTNNNVLATLKTDGQFEVQKIKTGSPTGGTAQPWRLGSVATVSPTSPNRTIEVEVNGTTYYLHAKTTNN